MKNISIRAKVFLLALFFGLFLIPVLNAGVITIPACAARPSDSSSASGGWYSSIEEFYFEDGDVYPEAYIPLNLPNGVSIKKLRAVVSDGVGGDRWGIYVELLRIDLLTGTRTSMAFISTWAAGSYNRTPVTTTSVSNRIVNNNLYAYALLVSFDYAFSDKKFHGAQIFY